MRGDDGMILESAIDPVKGLPTQADVNQAKLSDERVKEVNPAHRTEITSQRVNDWISKN